jgi:hypothetical protein
MDVMEDFLLKPFSILNLLMDYRPNQPILTWVKTYPVSTTQAKQPDMLNLEVTILQEMIKTN